MNMKQCYDMLPSKSEFQDQEPYLGEGKNDE